VVDRVVAWRYLDGYDYRRYPLLQDAGIAKARGHLGTLVPPS
jgi:hypothetical protein